MFILFQLNSNGQIISFPSFLVFALCSGLSKISSVKLQIFCDGPFTCWLKYFPAKFRKILTSGSLEISEFPIERHQNFQSQFFD